MHEPVKQVSSPDWNRERVGLFTWAPSRRLIRTVRNYQRANSSNILIRFVCRPFILRAHRFWSVITGADIPLNAQIGGGLFIPHPNGVVIHSAAKVGINCTIFQQVTIGGRDARHGAPVIGDNVLIGAGAKVLGSVCVGDSARIGANAVVLSDVPPGATAVGVPATLVPEKKHALQD